MQLLFTFETEDDFILPLHYNHLLQGFIYNAIDPQLSQFLHEDGYLVDNRPFRLFVFSRLMGSYQVDSKAQRIRFGPKVQLWVSSPLKEFCLSMTRNIFRRGDLVFGDHILHSVALEHDEPAATEARITVQTFSPVTVYSTLLRPEGGKYTAYFQPGDPDYDALITENLRRKYQAAYHQDPPKGEVAVQARSQLKRNILRYKDFIIKGYSGRLQLQGPPELLQMALDAGLGAKNSQGLGFVRLN